MQPGLVTRLDAGRVFVASLQLAGCVKRPYAPVAGLGLTAGLALQHNAHVVCKHRGYIVSGTAARRGVIVGESEGSARGECEARGMANCVVRYCTVTFVTRESHNHCRR